MELTRRLPPDSAVQVLLNMAEQFHLEGDWQAAEETYLVLTQHYVNHPLTRQAFIRLIHYAVSGELLASELKNEGAFSELTEWVDDPRRPGRQIPRTVVTREPISANHRIQERNELALAIAQFLDHNILDLANKAALRFALASTLRRSGWEQEATRFYQARSNPIFDDVWGMRARTELWLSIPDRSALPMEQRELPMPAMTVPFSRIRPFLDGQFDDELDRGAWNNSSVYSLTPATPRRRLAELLQENADRRVGVVRENRLQSMSSNFGTQVMFLHDGEHWYIGMRCPKVPEFDYPTLPPGNSQALLRDSGSPDMDRIEILIDIDRDYSTYYSLVIDYRGWVTDAKLGGRNWNPQWQVARYEDDKAWYIEAAIPFAELSKSGIQPNTIWGIAIRRLVPGLGTECWNAENSFNLHEAFGLLVFP